MTYRAAIYARTCVDDGHYLAEQIQACREYAQARGLHVVAEYAEAGRGAGDRKCAPPQLDHALSTARAGEYDVLVVRDEYRLSRSLRRFLSIVEALQSRGVRIEYVRRADGSAAIDRP